MLYHVSQPQTGVNAIQPNLEGNKTKIKLYVNCGSRVTFTLAPFMVIVTAEYVISC